MIPQSSPPPSLMLSSPPRRTPAQRITRVLWASFPVWSIGFLCWVPSLRLAIVRQTTRAWLTFGGIVAGMVAGIWIDIATSKPQADTTSTATWPGVLCFFTLMAAPTVHYCLATRVRAPYYPAQQPYQAPQGFAGEPTQPTQPIGPRGDTYVSPEEVQAGLRELRGILGRREEP